MVSVIIPAYNAAARLPDALRSVAAQTYRDFEVVVVDDGSTDGTSEASHAEFERLGLGRARVLERPREPGSFRNAGIARNAGAAVAAGDYLAFLDADDVWYPAKLDRVVEAFATKPQPV